MQDLQQRKVLGYPNIIQHYHQSLIHKTNLAIINLQVTEFENIPILSVFLVPKFDVGLSDGMV